MPKVVRKQRPHKQSNLQRMYFDPATPASFSGAYTFRKTHKNVKDTSELINYPAYTLHRPVRRKFKRNRVVVSTIDSQWQIDLTDLSALAKYNDGYRYLLFCIDVLSKYLWVVPMKRKTETVKAFLSIINNTDRRPDTIQADHGSEFLDKKMQRVLKKMNIDFFATYNVETKASICERVQRTIKGRMYRYFTHHHTNRYIDVLAPIVQSYNNTWHRSIKRTPASVNKHNAQDVWNTLYSDTLRPKDAIKAPNFKFAIGDTVRISQHRAVFRKGYMSGWTIEIFKINERIRRQIPMYTLEDLAGETLKGSFYEAELLKVKQTRNLFIVEKVLQTKTYKGKKQYLVSWLGYPSKFNSWVDNIEKI